MDATKQYTIKDFQRGIWTIRKMHTTEIVSFCDRVIRLDSGGHRDHFTKQYINEFAEKNDLRLRVEGRDPHWFVRFQGGTRDFVDNMMLDRIMPVVQRDLTG